MVGLKKVLYLHSVNGANIGDDITLASVISMVNNAIGPHEVHYADLCLLEPDYDVSKVGMLPICDILVIGGTPWLWNSCEVSVKYKILTDLLEVYKDAPKIAVGLGSCYKLHDKAKVNESIKDLWSQFDYVGTRDIVAHQLLEDIGISNNFNFCTSGYIDYPDSEPNGRPTLVFYNPEHGISGSVLTSEYMAKYIEYQLEFIEIYNPKVLVICPAEQAYLKEKGIESIHCKSFVDIINNLQYSEFVLSGRVHSAIPSKMMGINVYILPVDSRVKTATNFKIPMLNINDPVKWIEFTKEVKSPDIRQYVFKDKHDTITNIRNICSRVFKQS